MRLVLKFGGTSVGSADAIRQVSAIVADLHHQPHDLIVVSSAMSGITDLLLAAAHAAAAGRVSEVVNISAALRLRHMDAAQGLIESAEDRAGVVTVIDQRLAEFARLAEALAVLGEASPRALDAVASLGERLSVPLLAGAFRAQGVDAVAIDAAEVVRTDSVFQAAAPQMADTRTLAPGEAPAPLREPARSPWSPVSSARRPPASSPRSAAAAATTAPRFSAQPSMPTRCGSTRTWTGS